MAFAQVAAEEQFCRRPEARRQFEQVTGIDEPDFDT
jgi:hypothetical protein